jgi:hypothetical protein
MALPTGIHREPPRANGTPGRVFTVDAVRLSGDLENVVRRAAHPGAGDEGEWGTRTIIGRWTKASPLDLGIIDANGFATLLPDQAVEVYITTDPQGPSRALMVYGANERLRLLCIVPPQRFAWLWNEMLSRPAGRLWLSLSLPALSEAEMSPGHQLPNARYFADENAEYWNDPPARTIEFVVEDDWGAHTTVSPLGERG